MYPGSSIWLDPSRLVCNFYSSHADNDLNKCNGILIARFCFEPTPPIRVLHSGEEIHEPGVVAPFPLETRWWKTKISRYINKNTNRLMNDAFHTKFRQRELIMATFDIVRIECLSATRNGYPRGSFRFRWQFVLKRRYRWSSLSEPNVEGEKEKVYIGARYGWFFLSIRYWEGIN